MTLVELNIACSFRAGELSSEYQYQEGINVIVPPVCTICFTCRHQAGSHYLASLANDSQLEPMQIAELPCESRKESKSPANRTAFHSEKGCCLDDVTVNIYGDVIYNVSASIIFEAVRC